MTETINLKVPLNIRWTQEFVDDGKRGDKFYIRLTPKIQTGGRYSAGTSTLLVNKLLTVIPKLKREASNEIQRAARYGAQQAVQGMNAEKYRAQKRQEEVSSSAHLARVAEETRQQNEMFGPSISSSRFEEMMRLEAEKRGDTLNYAKEEKEEDEKSEKEEVYYIK